jgi:hypothetical protein
MVIKPNLFIVGSQKSGTTSLHDYLKDHSDVFMSKVKEPGFHIKDPSREHCLQSMKVPVNNSELRSLAKTHIDYDNLQSYESLFSGSNLFAIRGESSTVYFPCPDAAKSLKQYSPNAKVIVVLRNQSSRAYSAYVYNKSRGMEPAATFMEAIEAELNGERDDWEYGWRYLYVGLYQSHLNLYYDQFGVENVHVIKTSDMVEDLLAVLNGIYDFLGIEKIDQLPIKEKSNQTIWHANAFARQLKYALSRPNPLKKSIMKISPDFIKPILKICNVRLRKYIDKFGRGPAKISPEDKSFIEKYYQSMNEPLVD